jgi:hypothetical protein
MNHRLQIFVLVVSMVLSILSCSKYPPTLSQSQEVDPEEKPAISQSQVIDIVWDALEPNTSSHNRSNWQVVEVQLVIGESVAERFEGEPAPGCWSGLKLVENKSINSKDNYWFVLMTPKPATPMPSYGTPSPTAPPLIPEPFLMEAYFLVDPETSDIVARRLICVIY